MHTCIALLAAAALAEQCVLPPDFAERAYGHVVAAVAASPRPPASEGERRVVAYTHDQFRKMGLKAEVEDFEFESYEIDAMQLRLGESVFRPVFVAFNPYAGVFRFEGDAEIVDPQNVPDIENRYVISAASANYFQLMVRRPKLVVFVAPADFARLKGTVGRRFELTITGHTARHRSANVIGEVAGRPGVTREIILSAHLDAHGDSPGASDNASGLGVLIELARHFKSMEGRLGARMKFAAFGAEELALVGSRAYVLKHADELRQCAFNLNIDDIGGPRCPVFEVQGEVAGIPERPGVNLFPADLMAKAWEGMKGDWRIFDPRLLRVLQASNHPEWLKTLINGSANALGAKIIHAGTMASDQLVFTQAGVPATGVACTGNMIHSPRDTADQVRKANLELVGRMVACIVVESGR